MRCSPTQTLTTLRTIASTAHLRTLNPQVKKSSANAPNLWLCAHSKIVGINTPGTSSLDRLFCGENLGRGKGGISRLTKDVVSRIELTKNAFVMALIGHINGDIWK